MGAAKTEKKEKIVLDMRVKIAGKYEEPGTILTLPASLAKTITDQKAGHPYKAPVEKEVETGADEDK